MPKMGIGFRCSLLGVLLVLVTVGCQPRVFLMPTPAILATGELNPFAVNPQLEADNRVPVFYATNRIPFPKREADDRHYWIFPDKKLHLGIADLRIGEPDTPWHQVFQLSTSGIQEKRPALELEKISHLVSLPITDPPESQVLAAQPFFEQVNAALDASIDKDIMVYVHGANSNFYRASAQAAQYHHFTGRNSVVLAFLWPSAENILAYGTDVRHARKSVLAFARLIGLLATRTNAKYINILAYSAGSQIVSPAMALIGQELADDQNRTDLRLGEVYFAAGDVGTDTFVDNLKAYYDLPRAVTITINPGDSVLGFAEKFNRVSRLGRPNGDDVDPDSRQQVYEWSNTDWLQIIAVDPDTVPGLTVGAHDFWYNHPWISSDVLVQFLFHTNPDERGLMENRNEFGLRYWTFPPEYDRQLIRTIQQAEEQENKPAPK